MNERIIELAEQAGYAVSKLDAQEQMVMGKLAELILKECVAVIKQNEGASLSISNFTDEKQQGIQLGLEFAICDIEEHFGVES